LLLIPDVSGCLIWKTAVEVPPARLLFEPQMLAEMAVVTHCVNCAAVGLADGAVSQPPFFD